MSATQTLLRKHGIETRLQADRLEALDVMVDATNCVVTTWLDVTDWTRREVLIWLGY